MRQAGISVVTGGASGIGAACVQHLLQRGDRVVVVDMPGAFQQDNSGPQVAGNYECDVTHDQALRDVAAAIEKQHGPVTALVNSAGILQRRLSPDQLSMQEWDRVIAVDQRGTYLSCVVFGQAMVQRGRGAIVNIASITATRSVPLHAYAPAKAAVLSITQCLAGEWGRSGVRVNAVSPGYVLTAALQAAIARGDRNSDDMSSQAAMGRLVEVSEVADAVGFLLSDAARAITGINLPVDAGWLAGASWMTYGGVPSSQALSRTSEPMQDASNR